MIINITQRQLENKKNTKKNKKKQKKQKKNRRKKKNSVDIFRRKYKEFLKETVNSN